MEQKTFKRAPPDDPHFDKRNALIAKAYVPGKTTLQQVGDRFGLTRERIRQILNRLKKLEARAKANAVNSSSRPTLHSSLRG